MKRLFGVGTVILSADVENYCEDHPKLRSFIMKCLDRHMRGDWAEMEEDEIEMCERALRNRGQITSHYYIPKEIDIDWEENIWIMTEPDRSGTTVMFESEYLG